MKYEREKIQIMKIIEIDESRPDYVQAIQALLPQLSTEQIKFNSSHLEAMLSATGTHLLAAVNEAEPERILGILTLTLFRIPTALKAHIDDVVVDEQARGLGIGKLLILQAIDLAKQSGVKVIHLTSNPRREAANRLYPKLGFTQYHTNMYQLDLTQEAI